MSLTSPPTETPSPDPVLTLPPLPDLTLAPRVLDWCQEYVRQPDGPDAGQPWRFTLEQQRFLWYLYAIDDRGRFLWSRAVLRRAKGWGKSPVMAALALAELCGPVRFDGLDARGEPVGVPASMPWVQIAGVSEKQTTNTMSMVLAMIAESPIIDDYSLDPGLTRVFAANGGRLEPITASAPTAEGARPTFCVLDETHHWLRANGGHKLAEVIRRNLGKSRDGMARSVETTNAHQMGMESVAERSYDAWQAQLSGRARGSSILYDSREAPPGIDLFDENELIGGLAAAYGDSDWVDLERIRDEVYDPDTPPPEGRRFYLNQLALAEDAWIHPQRFDDLAHPEMVVSPSDEMLVFFDGSKSDDATAIAACRLSDGHVVTVGMWQRPPGERGSEWLVPRSEVDATMSAFVETHKVIGLFGDPSHTLDDVSQERFWDALIDEWHRRWSKRFTVWAKPGRQGHAVLWDMTSPARTAEFTAAAERCAADIDAGELTWDGDRRMRTHVHNARRYPNRYGTSLWKGHRESARKIDLAVCMIGARMVRRLVLNNPADTKQRTGVIW